MKSFKTAVVVIPPFDLWEPIQEIRRRHDRKIERWMPHITLVYPFVPPEEFDDAEARIAEATAPLGPFSVRLARVRSFDHGRGNATAWLAPEPAEPLERLHAAILAMFPKDGAGAGGRRGFTPHLSIGQFRGRLRLAEFLHRMRERWEPVTFTVKEVCMIRREDPPEDVFHLDRAVALGAGGRTGETSPEEGCSNPSRSESPRREDTHRPGKVLE